MTSFGPSVFFGIGLVVLGSIFTWNNEANQVCTAGAYQVASAETHELNSCSVENQKHLDSFMHLTCPVEDSLITSDSFTGISARGAYKLTFLTEQYGYTFTSGKQTQQQCDKNGDCVDKTESCSCLQLGWTTTPAKFEMIDNFQGTWCESCKSNVDKVNATSIDFFQTISTEFNEKFVFDKDMLKKNWYSKHPGMKESGWKLKKATYKEETDRSYWLLNFYRSFAEDDTAPFKLGSSEKLAEYVPLGDGTLQIDGKDISKIRDQQPMPITSKPTTIEGDSFVLASPKQCGQSGTSSACYYAPASRDYDVILDNIPPPSVSDRRIIVKAYGSKTISALGQPVQDSINTNIASIKSTTFGKSKIPPCKARSIFYVSNGSYSKDEIYELLQDGLKSQTAFFRVLTFMLIGFGFHITLSPLQSSGANIPIIGSMLASLVGFVLYIFTALLTSASWFTVFALAWVFYRPLYGMFFLLIAGCFYWGTYQLLKKSDDNDTRNYSWQSIQMQGIA